MDRNRVSEQYLHLREQVLQYTNDDINLKLENDNQVYIAVFDVPTESLIVGGDIQTYALVFGLNTHIYFGSGDAITGLEKRKNVMMAMQSLLISAGQVLGKMEQTNNVEYYENSHIRAYLKTRKGIFFRELNGNCKEDKFLSMLLNNLRKEISGVIHEIK